ncbi:nuclear transport factor 2 family protein [Steroidobacter sp. S1-65]|uniref:Nuclear transport factor 2 family protein n=1 Tax=Steroidobacter gossypii TaxID=2805490 RepID=A0ABS1X0M2_9GAMM|nr:nuclear transport factor 2 family protein [Steroidobacter gossypii]MBM0106775.1 nuclear transport factor 2 family protein [Steroidobacter gossypii]
MSTESVARRLVQLCREGKFDGAQDELYAPDARSIEMEGMIGELGSVQGLEAIREKGRKFSESYTEVHGVEVSDPLIADPFFSIVMAFDATFKEGGRRAMREICVYEVRNDKIVREQFFYAMD